jgi:hypothetical protein
MSKIRQTLLSASSAMAIAMLAGVAAPGARAADVVQACQPWAGTVTAGYIFGDHDSQFSGKGPDFEADFGTFFGEGEALYHFCDTNLNVQGDGAFHNHQYDDPSDSDNERWHVGGILFWRDQDVGVLGLDVSFLNDEIFDESDETWRLGARGEYFGGDMFTLGAGAGYLNGDFFGKDTDGFDVNAWARMYPTENLGLLARFDYATQDVGLVDWDIDHWAIGGEGEYLLPNLPLSIFAGARYGETDIDTGKSDFSSEVTEIYAGLSIYFGSDGNGGSLASHHRNNTLDNTSVIFERLPNVFAGKSSL